MRVFDVFHHPEDGYEAVKHGFSWPAFFFGWVWALVKDLEFAVFGLLAAVVLLVLGHFFFQQSGNSAGELLAVLAQLSFFTWIGFSGNNWRRANLLKRGFVVVGKTGAKSPKKAIGKLASTTTGETVDA